MPSSTRCRLRDLVELLNTSDQVTSPSRVSISMVWSISLSWPITSASSSLLFKSRLMTCRACTVSPRFASHRGVSGRNGQQSKTRVENKIWHATGKRHWKLLFAERVAKQSQDAVARPRRIKKAWTTIKAPRLCDGRVSDCKIGTATVDRPSPTPAIMRATNIWLYETEAV